MERSLHNVANLPEAARSEVERLVGHLLRNDDVLYIASLGVQDEQNVADRNAAWDEVESLISETQRNAAKSGLSFEQIDALIDAEYTSAHYA